MDDFASGVGAGDSGQAVTGVSAGAAEEKAADGRFVAGPIENGPHGEKLIESKLAELTQTIALRRSQGFDAALKVVAANADRASAVGVRAESTSDTTVQTVVDVASACGKHPVVITDSPSGTWGFVANRVYGAMIQEANRCVDEGIATREQVDMLMVDCFRWPVGPFGMVQGATSGWGQ